MPLFQAEFLRLAGARVLAAAGAPQAAAREVADCLVEANLAGHDSHGIIRIPQYVATIERGDIDLEAQVEIERQTPVSAVLDGHWGFGAVLMGRAVDMGLERARQFGVAILTLRRANHIGRLGGYVERLAREGMVGLLLANMHGSGVCVVPWGGRAARLGTNPLAVGAPRAGGEPLVLDMTTSVVAEGKVRVKRNRGESLPEGWIVDAEGRPSTDANAFYGPPRGGILSFGGSAGHKGYGLNVAIELLAGALSGAGCAGSGSRNGNGVLLMVLDPDAFCPAGEFAARVEQFAAFVKSASPAPGCDGIRVPGEVEALERRRRLIEGIFVEEQTWGQVESCAAGLGAPIGGA